MDNENRNIEERIAHLISDSDDIPKICSSKEIPEKYRQLFIHTEGSFVEKYCISEELQEKLRNIRNELYYRDFIYEIKKLANINQEEDKLTEERIELRYEDIETKEEEIICYELSYFTLDVFNFIKTIETKVGVKFNSIYEISKYQEIVEEELSKIEETLSKETIDVKKVEKNKRNFFVTTINSMHFDVLAVPNSKKQAFVINPDSEKDIFTEKTTDSRVRKILKRAEQFRKNNLGQTE